MRYAAKAATIDCAGAPIAFPSGMARNDPHRTKRKLPTTAQGSAAAGPLPPTCDGGDDPVCETIAVVDDLPTKIAISSRELDVIDAFLGPLLDDLLK
ncbi:hypothetical protein [Bradyrhizobium sp. CCBAU 53340]|uniref:hypothetical protein n=1 Tax=Bradyrhizobium sp. CCBAU 53340 TaxID=1325112 RepID=UPI00188D0AAB|nr:hypothetical protein [Bradyrhizobium sp. CCBAU 53340]